jgi:hypothetical protein
VERGRGLLVVARRRRLLGEAAGGLGGGGVRLLLPEEGLHVAAPRHGSGERETVARREEGDGTGRDGGGGGDGSEWCRGQVYMAASRDGGAAVAGAIGILNFEMGVCTIQLASSGWWRRNENRWMMGSFSENPLPSGRPSRLA